MPVQLIDIALARCPWCLLVESRASLHFTIVAALIIIVMIDALHITVVADGK